MSPFWTSFAWLAGPLAGLIFQPIAGVVSDRWEGRWGRRRPFIVAGALISVVGFIFFANPQWLASILGQPDNTTIQIVCTRRGKPHMQNLSEAERDRKIGEQSDGDRATEQQRAEGQRDSGEEGEEWLQELSENRSVASFWVLT